LITAPVRALGACPKSQTYQLEHFLDPGYLGHQAASRTSGVTALRLANADALPLRPAAQFLPGIRDALDAGDAATVTTYRDLLLDSLERATATAARAAGRSAVSSAAKRRFATRSTAAAAAAARRSARASADDSQAP